MKACPGPVLDNGTDLAETERNDAINRGNWLICIERHNALRDCVKALGGI